MKLSAILPLLAVTLLQEAVCTHLETCPCDQIRELVNTTVQEAVAGLEDRLTHVIDSAINNINTTDSSALENMEYRLTKTMQKLLAPIQQQLDYHLPPPKGNPPPEIENSEDSPASSCKDLINEYPQAPSGYYWISNSGSPVRVYCAMNISTCGQQTGGWMRVANFDMTNTSHTCPNGLSLISASKRLCDVTSDGCVSNTLDTQGVQYSHVCGRIIAYQNRVPLAFHYHTRGVFDSIDEAYVFGVSLTHGRSPRKHIWTFAGAADESSSGHNDFKCPCTNTALTPPPVPDFLGNDYFCDTGLSVYYESVPRALQTADPLWDGKGCGPTNTCCSFNDPPWFVKDLPSPTTDDVEMRVCQSNSDGSTPFETVDIYVQ